MTNLRARARSETGAALVEFALIVPVFFLLIIGMAVFGMFLGQKIALNQAVREGARAAVVQPVGTVPANYEQKLVRDAAVDTLIKDTNTITVTTSGSCSSAGIGNNITVTAKYTAVSPFNMFGNQSLQSQATFRCEW